MRRHGEVGTTGLRAGLSPNTARKYLRAEEHSALWQRLLGLLGRHRCLSMGDYVTRTGAKDGATAAGGRSC
jgi:hypothetical protein